MRIAVLIKNTTLHENFGGFETQNKALCEGLVAKGHEVIVFSPKKELSMSEKDENGVKYVFVDCIFKRFSSVFGSNQSGWQNRSFEAVKNYHDTLKFDIVLSQSSWGLGVIKRKDELGVKVLSISHGSKLGEAKTRLDSIGSIKEAIRFVIDIPHILRAFFITQRQFIHGSDRVVAVSNAVKKAIIGETYLLEDKVFVVNNGINPKEFHEENTAPKNDVVKLIYVGRVLRSKGLFVLLKAIKGLKNELENARTSFILEIVGDGPALSELQNLVSVEDLLDVVILNGWADHSDVVSKLLSSDVFVLPSLRVEGFPMVLVEAMFASLPIIASDIGGNSDALEEGKTGYLLKPGDVSGLQEKLKELVLDKSLRETMGKNARIKAESEFSLDIMINKYEKLIEGLLNENS